VEEGGGKREGGRVVLSPFSGKTGRNCGLERGSAKDMRMGNRNEKVQMNGQPSRVLGETNSGNRLGRGHGRISEESGTAREGGALWP